MNYSFRTFIIILIFSFFGCKPNYTEVIQSLHPDGSRQIVYYYDLKGVDSTLVMMKEFYPSSQNIRIQGSFKNNERDGMWKSWRPDGKIWSEAEFKEGRHNGISKVYHENGNLYYSGSYTNDERSGTWKFYNDEGKVIKEITY